MGSSEKTFRPIDHALYDRLLDAFRERPGNISFAARSAGVARDTARRAWQVGWLERELSPIAEAIRAEQVAARAKRVGCIDADDRGFLDRARATEQAREYEEQTRMKAREDAIAARCHEAEMVRHGRANIIALMTATNHLLTPVVGLAATVAEKLESGEEHLSTAATVRFVGNCGQLVRMAAESAKITLQMGEMLSGEPFEVMDSDARNVTLDGAERLFDLARSALERIKAKGLMPNQGPTFAPIPG